jgi:DNA repair and recombination protein RAD52
MDWTKAANELAKPLSAAAVKERAQAGRKLSYIEGWHAIAEANRIFGFDAWTRETVEIKCVAEREREIGQAKKPGWSVSYIAKVRVTVAGVIREGVGAGHGIDADLGQAHESAIKEAETDAMKRALMTFGNPFGLALYDKTQANVSDESNGHPPPEQSPADPLEYMLAEIGKISNKAALARYKQDKGALARYNRLNDKGKDRIHDALEAREAYLTVQQQAAE